MDERAAMVFLSSLPRKQKLQFLGRLCHEVTIAGRETYDRADGVAAPGKLRALNEVQHRLTGVIATSLTDEETEIPDSFVATIFFGDRSDSFLARALSSCFERQARSK